MFSASGFFRIKLLYFFIFYLSLRLYLSRHLLNRIFRMDCSESSMIVKYDATVVTGLEKLAIKEFMEKIGGDCETKHSVGHVFINTKADISRMSKLHSVDNIYVVIYENRDINLSKENADGLTGILETIISECDWQTGIKVWMEASGFSKSNIDYILDKSSENSILKPSFRASCNRTGTHEFTSQEASCIFGGLINDIFHWPVSLKQFDMEILVTIKEKSLIISLCLTKESLYKRYIVSYGYTSLRGTIAYNLIQIGGIQTGDIVCDPLCGSGVIPVESSIGWPLSFTLCGDNNNNAIEKTYNNCTANSLLKTDILSWDATKMPFKNSSIDVFITDLPFGKRMGSKHINKTLYPSVLTEMARCAQVKTGRIVLLTQDKSNANRCITNPRIKEYLRVEKAFYVKVGGLDSSIYLLKRNNTPFK